MIYLIGGSSHVGKTLLSQRLMERFHVPYLSLDHVKMMFIRSGLTTLTVNDDYKMRYFLWPYVAELIKTAIENRQSMIVEGCYIPSEWEEAFEPDYLDNIRCVFITMSEAYLRQHFDLVKTKASVIEERGEEALDLERLINCSREFEEESAAFGNPCLVIDEAYDVAALTDRLAGMLEMK